MCRLALMGLCLASLTCAAETRVWRSATGQEQEGAFVKQSFGVLTVKTSEGKTLNVPISRLCKEDQAYLNSLSAPSGAAKQPAVSPDTVSTGDPQVVSLIVPGGTFKRTAEGETKISYEVYAPSAYKVPEAVPIIIAFSPSGSGGHMVNAMRAAADEMGWLLVGCNDLKNELKGDELVRKMEDEVLDDILRCLPYDKRRICLAGLSGGAARAYWLSARRKETFAGIVAYGGWLGGEEGWKKPFCKGMAVAQVNGLSDKNANCWVKRDAEALEKRKCEVKLFSFEGGHEIAPAEVTKACLKWMEDDWARHGSKRK